MELWDFTVHELSRLLAKREISATEITQSVLDRLQEVEPAVRAFVTTTAKQAIVMAQKVDAARTRGEETGALAGIPMALKDNICTRGIRTTCSSRMLEDFVPLYDATVAQRLQAAGAILVGKTNMDEFAMGSSTETSAFSPTRNPWDLERVPGGSSGGSAAAVAAGEATFSLGSDTGGSMRQPAAFCSVVGLKPSYGRVSRSGLVAFASSLDQVGCFTKDTTDSALVLNAIAGKDEFDPTTVPDTVPDYTQFLGKEIKGLRIGLPREYFGEGIDPSIKDTIKNGIQVLEGLGAVVEETSLPHVKYAPEVYYLVAPAEASSNLGRFDGVRYGFRVDAPDIDSLYNKTRSQGFGPEVQRRIMIGTYVLSAGNYNDFYEKAQRVRTLIVRDFKQAFSRYDVLLTPTSPAAPFKLGEKIGDPLQMYLMDICTIPVNLAGLPAVSVPAGFRGGLPVGMQLVAKPFAEGTLIQVASAFEQVTDYHKQRPQLMVGGERRA